MGRRWMKFSLSAAPTYALLCRAFRALTLVFIALGVVALVLWLVYQPRSLKVSVDSTQLTRFDLTDNGTGRMRYDLTVGVSVRNPNWKQAVLYRRLEAVALYVRRAVRVRGPPVDAAAAQEPGGDTAELPQPGGHHLRRSGGVVP
ncbi:hypothetical protein PVAP13_8KG043500 [Panicum virgatum]|uniref:Late embryogenesis abundant protein LEA-2 subgroup domain-containing protein n=1 Tax=Panicum virgatum TaxID=38727 RepID=A0A8T0PH11_PANVG|nr:hypothetical protein PVAP13_8KG043500 [Panicum virgatum]